ncbi:MULTISPECIES: class I SAM-dependent methyltransferase [Streptomyces]|uniref:Class I SAM-dependent methyltransferase n=1 Tax=Streptomyces mutomycini TaxID=284036 RepID=A0ABW0B1J1_9ACTN|nr:MULTISPECIES: class I SAM-dependent methyltransferase [Streptomyces]
MDAVDFSPVAVRRIAEAAAGRGAEVRAAVADVTRYAPEEGADDLVLISCLQLPRQDMTAVLDSACRAARQGATLLVVGHDATNLAHGTGGPLDPRVLSSVEQVRAVWEPYADVAVAEVARRPVGGAEARDTVVRAIRR